MLRMFYFSGTGNARNVAYWVARAFVEHGRDFAVVDLARAPKPAALLPGDELGLASPTHGFNFPPITLAFLFGLPRAPARNRAYVFNTRAGMRLFGLCLPGASGVAQLLAALVLRMKGYRVAAMRPVDLPSNWISIHPAPREATVAALHARLRFRAVDRLVAGTSLTHLGAWGRYRGVRTGGTGGPAAPSSPTGPCWTGMAEGSASWPAAKGS
jgi:hypothetical protein